MSLLTTVALCAAFHALIGLVELTLGHAILAVARPHDAGYTAADVRLVMQVGAAGGTIFAACFYGLVLLAVVLLGAGAERYLWSLVALVFLALGPAQGPLGVVALQAYAAKHQLAILSPARTAAAGTLGMIIVFGSLLLAGLLYKMVDKTEAEE